MIQYGRYGIISFLLIALLSSFRLSAQDSNKFEAAVAAIKKNIACCSAVFTGGNAHKATAMLIFSGGASTIIYNKGRIPFSFNLYELYKSNDAPFGVSYKAGNKTVVFRLSETSAQAIQFATPTKAKETYNQLLTVIHFDKEAYKPVFSLTVQQTIDSVNTLLQLMNTDKAAISLLNDSVFTIRQMPSIRYDINVKKLKSDDDHRFLQIRGIGFVPYIKDGLAFGTRITFQHTGGQSGFLKFTSADTQEQLLVYRLLIYLSDLMRK